MSTQIFIFNFFINGMLIFATSILLIELILFVFRIKSFRTKYFARLIPFVKVFLIDLFLYNFHSWAVERKAAPLICEIGRRILDVEFTTFKLFPFFNMFLHLDNNLTFAPADVLAMHLNHVWIIGMNVLFVAATLIGCISFVKTLIVHWINRRKILKTFKSVDLSVPSNKRLCFGLCDHVDSPGILKHRGKLLIFFPQWSFALLSADEIEAIASHELEHAKWFDNCSFIFLSFLHSLMRYNPLANWWEKFVKLTGELACDQKALSRPQLNICVAQSGCGQWGDKDVYSNNLKSRKFSMTAPQILARSKIGRDAACCEAALCLNNRGDAAELKSGAKNPRWGILGEEKTDSSPCLSIHSNKTPIHLASAIQKFAHARYSQRVSFASKSTAAKRIYNLSKQKTKEASPLTYINATFAIYVLISVLFGKIWIF